MSKHNALNKVCAVIAIFFLIQSQMARADLSFSKALSPSSKTKAVKRAIEAVQKNHELRNDLNRSTTSSFMPGDSVDVNGRHGVIAKTSPDGRTVHVNFGDSTTQFDLRYAKIKLLPSGTLQATTDVTMQSTQLALTKLPQDTSKRIERIKAKIMAIDQLHQNRSPHTSKRIERIKAKIMAIDQLHQNRSPLAVAFLDQLFNSALIKVDQKQAFLRSLDILFFDRQYDDGDLFEIVDVLDSLGDAVTKPERKVFDDDMRAATKEELFSNAITIVNEMALLNIPGDRLENISSTSFFTTSEIAFLPSARSNFLRELYFSWLESLNNDLNNLLPREKSIGFAIPLKKFFEQPGVEERDAVIFLADIDRLVMNADDDILVRQDLLAWLVLMSARLPLQETVRVVKHLANLGDNVAALAWLKQNMRSLRLAKKRIVAPAPAKKVLPASTESSL